MGKKNFKIIAAQSNIDWIGRKVTGSHNGTISIKDGIIVLHDNQLLSGNLVADTTSIKILDITDPVTNAQLAGHLASADFFALEQYPEAQFVITLAEPAEENTYLINGDLTIKEITHPASFIAHVNINDSTLVATGKIIIDRTNYDMKFRSGTFFQNLGDNLIYNNFELNLNITAKHVSD